MKYCPHENVNINGIIMDVLIQVHVCTIYVCKFTSNDHILTGAIAEITDVHQWYIDGGSAGVLSSVGGAEGAELQDKGRLTVTSHHAANSDIIHATRDCTANRVQPLNI